MIFSHLTSFTINVPIMVLFLRLSFMTRIVWPIQSHKTHDLDSIEYDPCLCLYNSTSQGLRITGTNSTTERIGEYCIQYIFYRSPKLDSLTHSFLY